MWRAYKLCLFSHHLKRLIAPHYLSLSMYQCRTKQCRREILERWMPTYINSLASSPNVDKKWRKGEAKIFLARHKNQRLISKSYGFTKLKFNRPLSQSDFLTHLGPQPFSPQLTGPEILIVSMRMNEFQQPGGIGTSSFCVLVLEMVLLRWTSTAAPPWSKFSSPSFHRQGLKMLTAS